MVRCIDRLIGARVPSRHQRSGATGPLAAIGAHWRPFAINGVSSQKKKKTQGQGSKIKKKPGMNVKTIHSCCSPPLPEEVNF